VTKIYNEQETIALLPYRQLVTNLKTTVLDYTAGHIVSPERLVVALQGGAIMLSMPASAPDIAIHKLVNVCPGNKALGLPTIHGQVMACDPVTGEMLFVLDGPTVTGRRTAAITALGIQTLWPTSPKAMLLIGTGKQAVNHAEVLAELFPGATLYVQGSTPSSAAAFCERHRAAAPNLRPVPVDGTPDDVEVVVTLTTSKTPVYNEAPSTARLVIGVGAFTPDAAEIAADVVLASTVFVDDPLGARHEAGDLIQAKMDWANVGSLAHAIEHPVPVHKPLLFKSVGCAAWDLAACRVARDILRSGAR